MTDNWFITQHQNETVVNDISDIVDTGSFSNFIKIAFDTNPFEMCFGAVLILVVGIYVNKKTCSLVKQYVIKYLKNRM